MLGNTVEIPRFNTIYYCTVSAYLPNLCCGMQVVVAFSYLRQVTAHFLVRLSQLLCLRGNRVHHVLISRNVLVQTLGGNQTFSAEMINNCFLFSSLFIGRKKYWNIISGVHPTSKWKHFRKKWCHNFAPIMICGNKKMENVQIWLTKNSIWVTQKKIDLTFQHGSLMRKDVFFSFCGDVICMLFCATSNKVTLFEIKSL